MITTQLTLRALAIDEVNRALDEEQRLLGLSSQARAVEQAALRIENDLLRQGVMLIDDEKESLRIRLAQLDAEERRAQLLEEIKGPEEAFAQRRADLRVLFDAEAISAEQLAIALERLAEAQRQYNESANQLPVTQIGSFAQTLTEFEVLGKEALRGLGDAIVDFAATGEDSFEEFTRSLLIEIKKILAEKAIIALIDAFSGGAFSESGLAGLVFGGGRAEGGGVEAGETVVVGEEGAELFTPRNAGTITPAGETAAMLSQPAQQAPIVNVTNQPPPINIINSTDPSDIPSGIESEEGAQAVLNVISRKKRFVKGALGE